MKLLKGIWIGFWSGLLLGILLKWIQAVTGEQVYTLLLNVDFLPLIGKADWSEPVEFAFHLAISLLISIAYVYLAKRRPIHLASWFCSASPCASRFSCFTSR